MASGHRSGKPSRWRVSVAPIPDNSLRVRYDRWVSASIRPKQSEEPVRRVDGGWPAPPSKSGLKLGWTVVLVAAAALVLLLGISSGNSLGVILLVGVVACGLVIVGIMTTYRVSLRASDGTITIIVLVGLAILGVTVVFAPLLAVVFALAVVLFVVGWLFVKGPAGLIPLRGRRVGTEEEARSARLDDTLEDLVQERGHD